MFDQSKLGYSFPPFTLEVERCKVHELTLAIGDENPIYHSREGALANEYRDVPISPTTPTIFSFWGNTQLWNQLAEIGLNITRILHGEEEYQYQAPIYPGDRLTGVMTIVNGRTRRGKDGSSMDIVTLETRYTNQDDQVVLTARTTMIINE